MLVISATAPDTAPDIATAMATATATATAAATTTMQFRIYSKRYVQGSL